MLWWVWYSVGRVRNVRKGRCLDGIATSRPAISKRIEMNSPLRASAAMCKSETPTTDLVNRAKHVDSMKSRIMAKPRFFSRQFAIRRSPIGRGSQEIAQVNSPRRTQPYVGVRLADRNGINRVVCPPSAVGRSPLCPRGVFAGRGAAHQESPANSRRRPARSPVG